MIRLGDHSSLIVSKATSSAIAAPYGRDCRTPVLRGSPRRRSNQELKHDNSYDNFQKAHSCTPVRMNGIDTPALLATINAVGAQPELGKFQFRAKSRWLSGTHSQSTMHGFFGAGAEHKHVAPYKAAGDHPAVLCGADAGPTPTEWVLHALASCSPLASPISRRCAESSSTKSRRRSRVILICVAFSELAKDVRNGYQGIKVSFEIDGDAAPDRLEEIVMQSKARSAVFDIITNGVPVSIGVKTPATA